MEVEDEGGASTGQHQHDVENHVNCHAPLEPMVIVNQRPADSSSRRTGDRPPRCVKSLDSVIGYHGDGTNNYLFKNRGNNNTNQNGSSTGTFGKRRNNYNHYHYHNIASSNGHQVHFGSSKRTDSGSVAQLILVGNETTRASIHNTVLNNRPGIVGPSHKSLNYFDINRQICRGRETSSGSLPRWFNGGIIPAGIDNNHDYYYDNTIMRYVSSRCDAPIHEGDECGCQPHTGCDTPNQGKVKYRSCGKYTGSQSQGGSDDRPVFHAVYFNTFEGTIRKSENFQAVVQLIFHQMPTWQVVSEDSKSTMVLKVVGHGLQT